MTTLPGDSHGDPHNERDVDAEFARLLKSSGLNLAPGKAPQELPDELRGSSLDLPGSDLGSADSPVEASDEERARARAAHPSSGFPGTPHVWRASDRDPDLDDDEVIYGDFEAPDPTWEAASAGALWSWTALIGGFVLMMVVIVSPTLPAWLGLVAAAASIGGLIALLLRVPRHERDDGDDGAQV